MSHFCRIISFVLLLATSLAAEAQVVDTKARGERFEHLWSVGTCAGRANEGLRTAWVEQLRLAKEHCGFQYLRMHGIFDDDMCIYHEKTNGQVVYNWQYVDEVYDRMLELGVRPFVELSFFPKGIDADGGKTQMWYWNRVSFDREKMPKWGALVKAFTQHVVDRYGLNEVRQWYFEVWNEPNLDFGFFDGTKSDYFYLYKVTADAVKSVDKELKVGGPATSNFIADHRHDGERTDNKKSVFYPQDQINKQQWKGIWIEELLTYCAQNALPVDFISTHAYPTDYALDPVSGKGKGAIRYANSLRDDLTWLRKTIAKSAFPKAEIHITEWSTSPSSRDRMHDLIPPAAYILKANLDNIGGANSVMYWTFTDIFEEKGGGEEIFHGGFGMINFQGIVKPSFHAYRMLHQLGDERLSYDGHVFVSRHSDTGKITALAFNYPEEFTEIVPSSSNAGSYMNASPRNITLTLTGLTPGKPFIIETLDKDHGNAYDAWQAMGAPHSPTREQTAYLKSKGWGTLKESVLAGADGTLTISRQLPPWTCILISQP